MTAGKTVPTGLDAGPLKAEWPSGHSVTKGRDDGVESAQYTPGASNLHRSIKLFQLLPPDI